jgi:carboxyl-terminal processing protease
MMCIGVTAPGTDSEEKIFALKRSFAQNGGAAVVSSLQEVDGRKVGYVQLSDFSAGSRIGVERALRDLDARGADAYVLDLRGNPGGVFEGALEIAGLFEGRDAVVARVASRSNPDEVFRSRVVITGKDGKESLVASAAEMASKYPRGAVVSPNAPLAVFVDGGSASSSEVLGGSLRDNCRGAIAGSGRSFGKGVIQGVFGLTDGGGVVVTVASYRTPAGGEIQGHGLEPNVKVEDGLVSSAARKVLGKGEAGAVDFGQVEEALRMCRADDRLGAATKIFPEVSFGATVRGIGG